MADPKAHDTHRPAPNVPAKVTDATFEPVNSADPFWDNEPRGRTRPPMSFSGRMFNVGWKGWTRLVIVCVIVGAIFQAGSFNPFGEGFTLGEGVGQIINGVVNIAAWAAQNGGLPLLLGALAVLPFWLIWRALVTLFNKDKPPGPHDRILPKERPRKPVKL
ncbi:MAG: hypothetical protein B7Y90_01725 [Alphaproteobacteria bacterium 32-64-14]|nr:MAG: hypothetical protein B7Y90_01725 [Alphaproteobacteria bacterium 32-64-14]